jgi:hypothetical protein
MAFDDPSADRQTGTGAGVLVAGVKALKDIKDPVSVLGIDADPIVANVDVPAEAVSLRADLDVRRFLIGELDGI